MNKVIPFPCQQPIIRKVKFLPNGETVPSKNERAEHNAESIAKLLEHTAQKIKAFEVENQPYGIVLIVMASDCVEVLNRGASYGEVKQALHEASDEIFRRSIKKAEQTRQ